MKVLCINSGEGKLRIYDSIRECAETFGVSSKDVKIAIVVGNEIKGTRWTAEFLLKAEDKKKKKRRNE